MLLYFIYYTVTKCYFSKCQEKKRQKSKTEEKIFRKKKITLINIIQNLFKVAKLSVGFVIASAT